MAVRLRGRAHLATLAILRDMTAGTAEQVVLAMMNLPRYRHQTLADLIGRVLGGR